jgi:hypothetical protein
MSHKSVIHGHLVLFSSAANDNSVIAWLLRIARVLLDVGFGELNQFRISLKTHHVVVESLAIGNRVREGARFVRIDRKCFERNHYNVGCKQPRGLVCVRSVGECQKRTPVRVITVRCVRTESGHAQEDRVFVLGCWFEIERYAMCTTKVDKKPFQ